MMRRSSIILLEFVDNPELDNDPFNIKLGMRDRPRRNDGFRCPPAIRIAAHRHNDASPIQPRIYDLLKLKRRDLLFDRRGCHEQKYSTGC